MGENVPWPRLRKKNQIKTIHSSLAIEHNSFCDEVAESMKKWGRYRVAPGFGLRFQIPMLGPAPLALDFAFPVCKDPNDVTEVFTFNLSGSR